jgi:uracil phosphoribosyltransferase
MAMMRGGEPMARGVYHRLPSAHFIHYDDKTSNHEDVVVEGGNDHLCQVLKTFNNNSEPKIVSVILVDSVINSGASIRRAIRTLVQKVNPKNVKLAIYVMTAVMQQEAAHQLPLEFPRVKFLALRVSKNQYVGRGGTDTGNRLFGTMTVE